MPEKLHPELADYVLELSKGFHSPRDFSIAAGLSPNVAGNVIDTGRASARTCTKLAKAAGVKAETLLALAGLIDEPAETEGERHYRWPEEQELVEVALPQLGRDAVRAILALARSPAMTTRDSETVGAAASA